MPFELNDKDHRSALCDIDPDLNFYQEFNQTTVKCNYYLETKFNDEMSEPNGTKDVLSLCHVNIRSARNNLGNFENYLNMLNHDFTVIGLSETWLNDDNSDLYSLSGYKVIGHHRVNRADGGVAVCVQEHVYFKKRPDLSYFDEDCETVFIEMEKRHQLQNHNVIIGVIYRPPNQDISSFNDKMSNIVNVEGKIKPVTFLEIITLIFWTMKVMHKLPNLLIWCQAMVFCHLSLVLQEWLPHQPHWLTVYSPIILVI